MKWNSVHCPEKEIDKEKAVPRTPHHGDPVLISPYVSPRAVSMSFPKSLG